MKIILADDHSLFRDGLRSMLEPGATCYEAATLQETKDQLVSHPDTGLILMDLKMPGMDEFDGLIQVRTLHPDIPLIVVSMHNEPEVIRIALSHGISGYIPKTHSFESMQRAIDVVLSGMPYVPSEVLEHSDNTAFKATSLTRRQKDVYQLLMLGKSNQEIADKLCISLSTVKMHVSTVLRTAGVKSRSQLLAARKNLIS